MTFPEENGFRVAAIIPCYRVRDSVLNVIDRLGPVIDHVIAVDDACPECSGAHIGKVRPDVQVLTHRVNGGVGAATVTGYRAALAAGFDIVVKIDGDGQMNPADIPALLAPLQAGTADYAKGDRLYRGADLSAMPPLRRVGNQLFTRIARPMTGLPTLSDPMNGFTAITAPTLRRLRLDALDRRFFFETDLLVQLARLGAHVADVPLPARYGAERSNLGLGHILLRFPPRIAARLLARALGR